MRRALRRPIAGPALGRPGRAGRPGGGGLPRHHPPDAQHHGAAARCWPSSNGPGPAPSGWSCCAPPAPTARPPRTEMEELVGADIVGRYRIHDHRRRRRRPCGGGRGGRYAGPARPPLRRRRCPHPDRVRRAPLLRRVERRARREPARAWPPPPPSSRPTARPAWPTPGATWMVTEGNPVHRLRPGRHRPVPARPLGGRDHRRPPPPDRGLRRRAARRPPRRLRLRRRHRHPDGGAAASTWCSPPTAVIRSTAISTRRSRAWPPPSGWWPTAGSSCWPPPASTACPATGPSPASSSGASDPERAGPTRRAGQVGRLAGPGARPGAGAGRGLGPLGRALRRRRAVGPDDPGATTCRRRWPRPSAGRGPGARLCVLPQGPLTVATPSGPATA